MDSIILLCAASALLFFLIDFLRWITGKTKKSDFPILIILGITLILIANVFIK